MKAHSSDGGPTSQYPSPFKSQRSPWVEGAAPRSCDRVWSASPPRSPRPDRPNQPPESPSRWIEVGGNVNAIIHLQVDGREIDLSRSQLQALRDVRAIALVLQLGLRRGFRVAVVPVDAHNLPARQVE